ncbi:plasmid maintenance system killer protein [Pseudomonas fluvialis]|uniref:type II toxin-antitoxin system RelE/ParE family toxin n=1 Tax=Pseudomonas fluvialis TaxID=1793966 RepID=UPI000B8B4F7D|nr:type II toxin-antitoxin system RelE/ParE family toxin [Pseudomonas fluvialis]OXM41549.1 plasmid maintenance system killer protein [Pseudomonas fluvialis]
MSLSFRCAETQALFESGSSRRWANVLNVATRKLTMLNAAVELRGLRSPSGNWLEQLQGDRAGQHSIRVNDQWRICFVWTDSGPSQVEIVDYH